MDLAEGGCPRALRRACWWVKPLVLCDQSDWSGGPRQDVSWVTNVWIKHINTQTLAKKQWIKTHSQTQIQGLHRHLTSSLCRSKLTAGPSGKRRGERLEGQQRGELGNAGVQGEQKHWLKQINLKQARLIDWFYQHYLPSLTSLFGYFTAIIPNPNL